MEGTGNGTGIGVSSGSDQSGDDDNEQTGGTTSLSTTAPSAGWEWMVSGGAWDGLFNPNGSNNSWVSRYGYTTDTAPTIDKIEYPSETEAKITLTDGSYLNFTLSKSFSEYLTGHPRREPGVSCKVLKKNKSSPIFVPGFACFFASHLPCGHLLTHRAREKRGATARHYKIYVIPEGFYRGSHPLFKSCRPEVFLLRTSLFVVSP